MAITARENGVLISTMFYEEDIKELIETKIAGREVIAEQPEGSNNVINLMDALKASIDQNKKVHGTQSE